MCVCVYGCVWVGGWVGVCVGSCVYMWMGVSGGVEVDR